MHQVIQHILERKNLQVPINDGRKIALVMYGGSMTCIRSIAVLQALSNRGLAHSFDEIYAISGGFAIAAHFLSGQLENTEHIFYEDFSGRKLINLLRFWRMFDPAHLVSLFKDVKPLHHPNLIGARTKLYLAAHNLDLKKLEYLEIHGFSKDDFFKLLEVSATPEYFTPGSVIISNSRYKDVPFRNWVHQEHLKKAIDSQASDILVVFNYAQQYRRAIDKTLPANALCIVPKTEWHLSRFETDPEKLKEQYTLMKDYMDQILSGIIDT